MPLIPDLRSLDRTCGGTGWLNCECGGDFCVCHLHGGINCSGCKDCRDQDGYPTPADDDDYFTGPCQECNTTSLLHGGTELCSTCYRKHYCLKCEDELAPDGSCYQCDPVCSYCHERPCIGICPTDDPDGEPQYTDDGHPY